MSEPTKNVTLKATVQVISERGVELQVDATVNHLDSDEAGETVRDLVAGLAPFDPVTGERVKL